jgi:Xaa-Pro aminopeptidase
MWHWIEEKASYYYFQTLPMGIKERNIISKKETNDHVQFGKVKNSKRTCSSRFRSQNSVLVTGIRKVLFELMTHSDTIYINTNEHYKSNWKQKLTEARFVKWWKEKYPAHTVAKSNPIYKRIRSVKKVKKLT